MDKLGCLLKDDADRSTIGVKLEDKKLLMMGSADEIVKAPEKGPALMEDPAAEEEQVVAVEFRKKLYPQFGQQHKGDFMQQISVLPFIFFVLMLLISPSSSLRLPAASNKNISAGINIEFIHRDSSRSPFYDPNITLLNRSIALVRRSELYVQTNWQARRVNVPLMNAHGEFLAVFGMGTPPVRMHAIMDTGSDLTWFQCFSCNPCFNQLLPLFNPVKSRSYTSMTCYDRGCDTDRYMECGYEADLVACAYEVKYVDHSVTKGKMGTETFTFHGGSQVSGIMFGCGYKQKGIFSEDSTGLIGLGTGYESLPAQLQVSKVSYCLPIRGKGAPGMLRLGSAAVLSKTRINMINTNRRTYFLPLEGISVGNVGRLKYPKKLFEPQEAAAGRGIMLDTGASLSWLYQEPYYALIDAVEEALEDEFTRLNYPFGGLELCYKNVVWKYFRLFVPKITYHFTDGDFVWNDFGTFMMMDERTCCLAVRKAIRNEHCSYLGAFQLQGYEVGMDLDARQVSFLPADPVDCTEVHDEL